MGCHGNAAILSFSKACLNLYITSCLICQILLPAIGGVLISPGKKVTAAKAVCGNLQKSPAGFIYIGNVFRASIRNIEEVIYRFFYSFVVGYIDSFHYRNIYFCNLISSGCKRLNCRYDHSSLFIFRNCYVAPPVHRNDFFSLVHNTHSAVQKTAVFFQPEVHLISYFTDPLIFIHTQNRLSVLIGSPGSIKRFCGKWIMSDDSHIPFYTAAEPGVTHCQITELQNIIGIQQIPARIFVPEFPQSATESREKYCL